MASQTTTTTASTPKDPTESVKEEDDVDVFELLCRYKDTNSGNLNEIFDSYGCNTLEAKVPVVDDPVVKKLQTISAEQQLYATLAIKSDSASRALQGRGSRTKNKPLSMVEINGQTLIAAGKDRERSPVDIGELDDELEQYMKEKARMRANKANMEALTRTHDFE